MFRVPTTANRLFTWLFPPVCVHCQKEGQWLCSVATASLLADPPQTISLPACDVAMVGGSYDQPVRAALIQKIKYWYWTAAIDAVEPLLQPLVSRLVHVPSDTVIVPVPLHRRRQRERGFNQSELIAGQLGLLIHRRVNRLVVRTWYTKPQAQLPATERQGNVLDAFAAPKLARPPSCAILVDDVITTGATISACAHVLRQAGVKKVIAVALAKG